MTAVPLKPPARSPTPARTPSPFDQLTRIGLTVTCVQKRSLMENLQLEVTARARKLRNQYKLQAQSLRAHIEMRINRVPSSLRRTKMGELDSGRTEQADQMNIIGPHNSEISKPLPTQTLEVLGYAKQPSTDTRSKKTMTKPAQAERSIAVSNNRKASEKAKPMVKVDKTDIYGPTEITTGRASTKSKSAERATTISNNAKIAGKAKPIININIMDISEAHKRFSVQLSAKPAPAERAMAVSKNGTTTLARIRGVKRKSDYEFDSVDKENKLDHVEPIPNPKKRSKITANGAVRKPNDASMVLSPKSSNSRTLPHPPVRHLPQKSSLAYPASPLKPTLSMKVAAGVRATAPKASETITINTVEKPRATRSKANTTRKATRLTAANPAAKKTRRGSIVVNVPPVEMWSISDSSYASNLSTGTTIKNPSGRPATNTAVIGAIAAASTNRKKNPVAVVRNVGKTAGIREGVAPAAERRVLRNRG